MRSWLAAIGAAILALTSALAMPAGAQDAQVPLSAYGQLPGIQDVAMSPGGSRIAVVSRVGEERAIIIMDAQYDVLKTIPMGDMKFRGASFADEDTLLIRRSETVDLWGFVADKYEMDQVIVISLAEGGETRLVFGESSKVVNVVRGTHGVRHTGDGTMGYYGAIELGSDRMRRTFDHGRPYLHEYNFATGEHRRVGRAPRADVYRDWIVGSHGGVAAQFDLNRETGRWDIRNSANDVLVEGRDMNGRVGMIGLGAGGASLLYYMPDEQTNEIEWYEVPLAGGASRPFADGVSVDRLFYNRTNGHLLGYLVDGEESAPVLFDEEQQTNISRILRAFAGTNPRIIDHDGTFDKVVVYTRSGTDSGTWYMVDVAGRRAEPIGFDRPLIPPERVAPVSTVYYNAQDGLPLDGILTLPLGREAENLPLIALPHGGPTSEDTEDFNWWAQAFASRGYAVFQPNFRGSSGRGRDFIELGHGEWGRKMQTDISDGIAHLADQGIVDPERACIVGASYGGYAALAGVTLQQGMYRCAVSVNGISDIWLMFRTERREGAGSRLLEANLRAKLGDNDNWDAISPRDQAANADAPILLIHGRDDTVVAFEQSDKMADALKDNGKLHRLIELDGEDHWLSLPETRIRMLEETMEFVLEHNPPYNTMLVSQQAPGE